MEQETVTQENSTNTGTEVNTEVTETVTTESEVTVDDMNKPETVSKEEVATEIKDESKKEIMIPKERFDEINNKYKQLKEQLDSLQSKEEVNPEPVKPVEETVQPEKNPELESLQNQLNEFQSVIEGLVTTKLEAIPEEYRELVPDGLTHKQKLDWINKAEEKGLFKKQTSNVVVGQPLNHSAEQSKAEKMKKLNPLQVLSSYYGGK